MTGGQDPDLIQAIEDLRPVAAELRKAGKEYRDLRGEGATLKAVTAAKERVADLNGIIATRARRLAVDPAALRLVLRVEMELRGRHRRKPAKRFIVKALSDEMAAQTQREHDANTALAKAQDQVRRAAAAREAADKAQQLVGSL